MWKLIVLFTLLLPKTLLACKMNYSSSWYFSKENLVKKSNQIVIAEVIGIVNMSKKGEVRSFSETHDYIFKIKEVIKGKKDKEIVILKGIYGSSNPVNKDSKFFTTSYGPDCKSIISFEFGQTYTLVLDLKNSHSYQLYNGAEDKWISFVKKQLSNKDK